MTKPFDEAREIDPEVYKELRDLASKMDGHITTHKPDAPAPQLLRDSTDGIHPLFFSPLFPVNHEVRFLKERSGKSVFAHRYLEMTQEQVRQRIEVSSFMIVDELGPDPDPKPEGEKPKGKTYMNDFLKQKQRGRRR